MSPLSWITVSAWLIATCLRYTKNKRGVLVGHRVQSAGLEVVLERVQGILYAFVAPAIGLLPRGPGAILGARAILDVPPKTILPIVIGRVDADALHRKP